jgi:hypothetical protein
LNNETKAALHGAAFVLKHEDELSCGDLMIIQRLQIFAMMKGVEDCNLPLVLKGSKIVT